MNQFMLSFGKYKGVSITDIHKKDKQYLQWLITQPWFKFKHSEDLKQILNLFKENERLEFNPDSFIIYTDGACPNNGSKKAMGGIGVHFSLKNKIKLKDLSRKLDIPNPTNNKAELMAIEKALEMCIQNNILKNIVIFTDSEYSMNCITLWYPKWVKDKKLNGKANTDILQRIDLLMKQVQVQFQHIRGHSNLQDEHSIGNAKADELATKCV